MAGDPFKVTKEKRTYIEEEKIAYVEKKLHSESVCFDCKHFPCNYVITDQWIGAMKAISQGHSYHLKHCCGFENKDIYAKCKNCSRYILMQDQSTGELLGHECEIHPNCIYDSEGKLI